MTWCLLPEFWTWKGILISEMFLQTHFSCCLNISQIVCFVMMSSSGAKFVLLLSLHNNSEAERCPDYWSISLHRHWRDSPGLPAQTGDDMILAEKYCNNIIAIYVVKLYFQKEQYPDLLRHDTTFSEIHRGNKIVKEFDNLFHLYLDGYKVWHHSRQSQSGPDEHQTLNIIQTNLVCNVKLMKNCWSLECDFSSLAA